MKTLIGAFISVAIYAKSAGSRSSYSSGYSGYSSSTTTTTTKTTTYGNPSYGYSYNNYGSYGGGSSGMGIGTAVVAGAAVGVVTGAVIAGSMDNHYGGGYNEIHNSGPNYGYHEDHGTSGWSILLWVLFGIGLCMCIGFIVNQQQNRRKIQ